MKITHSYRHVLAALVATLLSACASRAPVAKTAPGVSRAPEGMHVVDRGERPGLATGWGEQRESWVAPTYFARAWGTRPSAVEKMFYNDREGVDAMVDYLGGEPSSAPGLQRAAGGLVSVGLRNGTGQWYETLQLRNQRFAVGERGSRYEVVVKNDSRKRLEVVLSVDGLDTLDGESANFKKRGYVLGPRETLCVDGFRTSDGTVAAFRFTNVGDSYAQRRHQQTSNVGVIGLAVFGERLFGTKPANAVPENRAWRQAEPKEFPSRRPYATPPDA